VRCRALRTVAKQRSNVVKQSKKKLRKTASEAEKRAAAIFESADSTGQQRRTEAGAGLF
jgi:hypothetical protein